MASLIPEDINFNQNAVVIDRDSNDISQKDLIYQNGAYIATSSSILGSDGAAFKAFDNNPNSYWICNNPAIKDAEPKYKEFSYNGLVPSSYIGGGTPETYWKTIANNKDYVGEWIQIKLPYSVYLAKYSIFSKKFPRKFHILGSNDGSSWQVIDSQTLDNDYSNSDTPIKFDVKTILKLSHYRLVISQLFDGTSASINEFKLFGNLNSLVNIKSMESFSNYSNYTSSYNSQYSSQYNSRFSPLQNSIEYKPFSKFDIVDSNQVTEHFTSNDEAIIINNINKAINDLNDKTRTAATNYGNLNSSINDFRFIRDDLLNSSLYDYSGNILFLNNGKPTLKDALENDTKEFAKQENNVFILGSISIAILLLGTYVILRD